MGINLLKIDTK